MERIILASNSPRRQALMNLACIPFEQIDVDIDENVEDEVSPFDLVKIISARKAMSVFKQLSNETMPEGSPCTIIVSADTIISLNGLIMGKPQTEQDAFDMLKKLQNKCHSVYTGMTIVFKEWDGFTVKHIVDTTSVFMRALPDDEIWAYVKTGEPFDKAGAYAIQEKGALLIEKIEGDYYTIVGLPLIKLYTTLKNYGVNLTEKWV